VSRRRRHWDFLVGRPDATIERVERVERVAFYARTQDEALELVTAWTRRMGFELLEGAAESAESAAVLDGIVAGRPRFRKSVWGRRADR